MLEDLPPQALTIFEAYQGSTVIMYMETDQAVATTAFDMAGEWELDDAGTVHDMIVVFHPTDLYPYSMRYKNSGDTYLAPFQMPRKRIVFQPDQNVPFTAHLWDQRGIIALDNQRYVRRKLLESLPR